MYNEDLARLYPKAADSKKGNDDFVRKTELKAMSLKPESITADNTGLTITYGEGVVLKLPIIGGNGISVDVNENGTAIVIKTDSAK